MADTRKCMLLYHSWVKALEELSDEECGRLLRGALIYSSTGEAPELPGNERFTWPLLRYQIDSDAAKYADKLKKCSAAGTASANRRQQTLTDDDIRQQASTDERKIKEKEIEKKIENKTSSTKKNKADAFEEFANEHLEYGPELLKALREFEAMRNQIKKPLTDNAKARLIGNLKTNYKEAEWIPVLNQSVDHCWQDIYPLKIKEQVQSPAKVKKYTTAAEYVTMAPKAIDAAAVGKVQNLLKQWGVEECSTSA